jgi:hypothetical protein
MKPSENSDFSRKSSIHVYFIVSQTRIDQNRVDQESAGESEFCRLRNDRLSQKT